MEKRSLAKMALLMLVTLGIYNLYWFVVTKDEMNKMGAKVPTAWILLIPFVGVYYFYYKYAEAFSKYVNKNNSPIAYFALMCVLPVVSTFIFQNYINEK